MVLKVIGSSSKGNCYILENDREALIIEAGIKLMEVKKALNWNISKVVGCIVSHEHNDHAGYALEYAKAGIMILALLDVMAAKGIQRNFCDVQHGKAYKLGNFIVQPFNVEHDVPCVGYVVEHPEIGRLVFFTDTYVCRYRFKGVNTYLIEANYCDEKLEQNIESGKIPMFLRNRLMTSHMEIGNTLKFLQSSDLSRVRNIVLVHLSAANSNAADFVRRTMEATGKPVCAAMSGVVIDISEKPI